MDFFIVGMEKKDIKCHFNALFVMHILVNINILQMLHA